jgi:hypothetical protein
LDEIAPAVHRKPEPQLPMDDPRYDFEPAGHAGDALVAQASDSELFGKIVGFAPVRPVPSPTSIMADFSKRAARVLQSAPKHRRAIQAITDRLRTSELFEPIKNDPVWERLTQHATNYVIGSILETSA